MIRVYFIISFILSFVISDPLPQVHFSVKDFPEIATWQEHLGETSYITYEHNSNEENEIYSYSARVSQKTFPGIYNDDRTSFSGKFSSFCSTSNIRFLEALLAKGYHLQAYVHESNKGAEYTIIGYNRSKKIFFVKGIDGQEQKMGYDNFDIQYASVVCENPEQNWQVISVDDNAKILESSTVKATSIANALKQSGIMSGRIFLQNVSQSSPIKINGWSGETQFDQMIQFTGGHYNTLGERVVTIYISQQSATGCHMTRYTVGGKGDGYSDNVVSGDVYCFSRNPAMINKAGGLVQFVLRCKVKKNAAQPWWVKAQIFYRLYTPDGK
ncbi:hypothetical protein [Candidatus Uabimicrobium sp. HlEnr_7]|uniref:hypothetical protein n=1 Tax=Candidatus Uabimicrobium helgolandensis TaxID=3095367 RepID=UPI003555CDF6